MHQPVEGALLHRTAGDRQYDKRVRAGSERRPGAHSDRDEVAEVGEALLADAADLAQLVDCLEATAAITFAKHRRGERGADSREPVHLGRVSQC